MQVLDFSVFINEGSCVPSILVNALYLLMRNDTISKLITVSQGGWGRCQVVFTNIQCFGTQLYQM